MSTHQPIRNDDRFLAGGWQTTVHRSGDRVRRSSSVWSESVVDFLSHLERRGFTGSPRPIDNGFDDEGNELLTFIHGESPQPKAWNDAAIVRLGEMLADMHEAAMSYQPAKGVVAWLNVQLHDDDIAERVGLGDVHQRARQLRLLLDAYGLSAANRVGFIDKMIEVAVLDSAGEAVEHAVSPDTTSGITPDGYPYVWGISWRVRSAAWMLRNRTVLEAAI